MADELQRGEHQHGAAIAPELGQLVDHALLVDLLEAFEGERRARAVTQQPLQPCPVAPADTHCGIEREAAVVPRAHGASVIGSEQAAAGEPAQHPVAHLLGDGGDLLRCGRGGREESDRPVVARLEHPVEDAAGIVGVAVERGVSARTLSMRRRTVKGRITLPYSDCLIVAAQEVRDGPDEGGQGLLVHGPRGVLGVGSPDWSLWADRSSGIVGDSWDRCKPRQMLHRR
jgi:hypothetical protein